jgi:hypothetical protein
MTLVSPDLRTLAGVPFGDLLGIAESSALLLNISGHLDLEPLTKRIPRRAYIDLDPGFTQFWHADGNTGSRLEGHDFFFTVGENIGAGDCPIPTSGIRWRPTRQPVVLDHWPVSPTGSPRRFTTISTWRGPFGPVAYNGRSLGSKVREFRKYVAIPRGASEAFEIALDIHPGDYKDRDLLTENGWGLVHPREAVPDPLSFRRYIQGSAAEFSVAQEMYVETRCGWFSDRTVRYLASGKPALVQETGFSRNLPAGAGLVAFSTPEEAAAGVERIARDYSEHAAAARQIAEEHFASDRVLSALLDETGVCP